MNNQGHSVAQKEDEKSPETKIEIMEDLNDQAFNITVMKKFNDIEENLERQFNCSQKKNIYINEQKEYFTKGSKPKQEPNRNSGA